MLEPKILRTFTTKRFDTAKVRIDKARLADLSRTRATRAARLLGRQTPYDLKTPWLTLRPDRPVVPGKGWLEYTSPSSVGMGTFEDGEYMFAAFDLIFQKQETGSYSIERPQVAIRLSDPPKPMSIVELDIHAYDFPPGDPKFEIITNSSMTMSVAEGKRDTIMFLMRDFASIQSVWAEGDKFYDKNGNWAFFEARITPVE